MVLDIHNVGKIKQAELKFDGITVVAGPNSSGKSTLSKALYLGSLIYEKAWAQGRLEKIRSANRLSQKLVQGLEIYYHINEEERKRIRRDVSYRIRSGEFEVEDFAIWVEQVIDSDDADRKHRYEASVKDLVESYEQHDANYYINYAVRGMVEGIFKDQINTIQDNSVAVIQCEFKENRKISLEVEDNKNVRIDGDIDYLCDEKTVYITTSDLVDTMSSDYNLRQMVRMENGTYMNRKLAELLLQQQERELTAEEAERQEKQMEFFEQLLQQVINGRIQVRDGQLEYYDNSLNSKVEFVNMASGMKMFFILKRLIENGVLLDKTNLIIDEPESNLHPEWQLKLAELLVLMYQKLDVQIYINSHSPYFVRAMEYYSKKYEIEQKIYFYNMKASKESGGFMVEEVTDNIDIIYQHLSKPLNDVM